MRHAVRASIQPKFFLPVVIGVALLVALILVAGPQQALRLITHFHPASLIAFFLLMGGYEIVRCAQWRYLLTRLGLRIPLRTQIFAYALGEVSKNIPVGNFVPDYILAREQGADFGRASSSSLLISVLEVAVALAGIVIIGIDGWTWIRPLILIGTFLFVLLAWAFTRWRHHPHLADAIQVADASPDDTASLATKAPGPAALAPRPAGVALRDPRVPRWARRALRWNCVQGALHELQQFARGEETLLHPQVIAVSTLACALYMVFSGLALYVVIRGLGLSGIAWTEALAASFFSLAVSTIIPIPTDLGSSEASGAGALVALGLSAAGAVSGLLLYRFLNLVEQILVALLAILFLPGEFRALWRDRSKAPAATPTHDA